MSKVIQAFRSTGDFSGVAHKAAFKQLYKSMGDIIMFDIENNVLIGYNGEQTSVAVPEGVIEIARSAFSNTGIESVKLPDTLAKIGNGAFKNCVKLREVNLPKGLLSIGAEAFEGCAALKEICIPANIDMILQETFQGCGFTTLKIPKSIKRICWGGFRRCDDLEQVVLEEGVEAIGESAFEACRSLKLITIPTTVSEIADTAFFLSDNISFVVSEGSYAQQFASENNINYTLR